MRALAIDHRPEVGQLHNSLTMTEMASPEPRRGEVRIRVQATAINVDDQHFAEGTMFGGFPVAPKPSATRPWVPGTEFTGLGDQLGEGVTSLELGQPVYGMRPPKLAGPWAEYCVTKVNLVSPVPEGWPIDQAAALCLSGAVICSMLAPLGSLKDQHCLVVGASGSLGTVLVQVLSKSGARVWGVCSGVNRELVTGLGVQRVIDYKEGRFGEQLTREDISVICPPKTRPSPVLESGRGQDTKGEGTMAAPKRLSPAQIINRLRKAEVALANGNTTNEVCRELGVSEQTYYRWRREYGGMKLSQAKRLKELEKENQQLKRAVAELTLDKLILKEASEGNF